jgi:chromosome segregation ATPase
MALALGGCVGHARTTPAYRGKASLTADAAISALQTAKLTVDISAKGNMLGRYGETVLSQAEDDFGSVQAQFDSIQPPNTKEADDLRSRLDDLLSQGSDMLSQLRILSRRAEEKEMEKTAESIPGLVDKLDKFSQAMD